MPTILRINGLRVVIYLNDHRPSHVHVVGDSEAVFVLNCPDGPPELRETYGFNPAEVRRIAAFLADHLVTLCRKWRDLHGYD